MRTIALAAILLGLVLVDASGTLSQDLSKQALACATPNRPHNVLELSGEAITRSSGRASALTLRGGYSEETPHAFRALATSVCVCRQIAVTFL